MPLGSEKALFLFVVAGLAMIIVSITHFHSVSEYCPAVGRIEEVNTAETLRPTVQTAIQSIPRSKSSFFLHSLDDIYALVGRKFQGLGNGTIPRVVHITYKSVQLPQQYEALLRHCAKINPDVAFLFWTDEQADKFVSESFSKRRRRKHSEESRLSKFLSTYSGIEKADVIRLLLLYFLGGVYMDLDMECRQSFHQLHLSVGQLLNQKYHPPVSNNTMVSSDSAVSCIIDQEQWLQTRILYSREYAAMNNFMICRPRHPFFRYVLEKLKDNDEKMHTLDKTGPFMLTARYEEYNRILRAATSSNQSAIRINNDKTVNSFLEKHPQEESMVELAHSDWFSPLVDNRPEFPVLCNRQDNKSHWVKEACLKDYPHVRDES